MSVGAATLKGDYLIYMHTLMPQHDGGIKLKVKNLAAMFLELVQTLQPNSVNPTFAWYSQASQYNK